MGSWYGPSGWPLPGSAISRQWVAIIGSSGPWVAHGSPIGCAWVIIDLLVLAHGSDQGYTVVGGYGFSRGLSLQWLGVSLERVTPLLPTRSKAFGPFSFSETVRAGRYIQQRFG